MDRTCRVAQPGAILLAKGGSIYKLIASLSHLYGQQFPQEQVGYLHQGASEYWYHIRLISLLCVNSFQPRFDSLQGTVAALTIPQGKSGVEGIAWASLSSAGRSIRQHTSAVQRSHWNLGNTRRFPCQKWWMADLGWETNQCQSKVHLLHTSACSKWGLNSIPSVKHANLLDLWQTKNQTNQTLELAPAWQPKSKTMPVYGPCLWVVIEVNISVGGF